MGRFHGVAHTPGGRLVTRSGQLRAASNSCGRPATAAGTCASALSLIGLLQVPRGVMGCCRLLQVPSGVAGPRSLQLRLLAALHSLALDRRWTSSESFELWFGLNPCNSDSDSDLVLNQKRFEPTNNSSFSRTAGSEYRDGDSIQATASSNPRAAQRPGASASGGSSRGSGP
eukprot:364957-Chlamydomonas_euryale.AAC.7